MLLSLEFFSLFNGLDKKERQTSQDNVAGKGVRRRRFDDKLLTPRNEGNRLRRAGSTGNA